MAVVTMEYDFANIVENENGILLTQLYAYLNKQNTQRSNIVTGPASSGVAIMELYDSLDNLIARVVGSRAQGAVMNLDTIDGPTSVDTSMGWQGNIKLGADVFAAGGKLKVSFKGSAGSGSFRMFMRNFVQYGYQAALGYYGHEKPLADITIPFGLNVS